MLFRSGRVFARDHSTVHHSVSLISAMREKDEALRIDTDDLLTAIRVAAVGLERLSRAPIDDIDVREVATEIVEQPLKATTVSVNQIRALAASTLSQNDHVVDRQSVIDDVLDAARAFESARYSQDERSALETLIARIAQLRTMEEQTRGGQHGAQET